MCLKRGNLILYEKDTDYAIRFMEYMNTIPSFLLEVQVFTNLDAIKEYLEKHYTEIFLVHIDIKLEQVDLTHVRQVVYLTDDLEEENIEAFVIYKYQSAENIRKHLLYLLNLREEKKENFKRKDLEIIAVCSPYGGCGKTIFSLAYGQAAAKKRQCLYIGVEAIKSFENKEKGGSFSDLLYYLKQENSKLETILKRLSNNIGELDCITSPDCVYDLDNMERQDIYRLFDCLYKQEDYDVVIFDIGIWNNMSIHILEKVDRIYMIQNSNAKVFPKESYLFNWLCKEQENLFDNKVCRIEMLYDKDIADGTFKMEKLNKTKMGQWVWNIRENELINANKD